MLVEGLTGDFNVEAWVCNVVGDREIVSEVVGIDGGGLKDVGIDRAGIDDVGACVVGIAVDEGAGAEPSSAAASRNIAMLSGKTLTLSE